VQFIDDADSAHTESHVDSNPDTHCESGSSAGTRPDTDSFADASIANADAIAHAITDAFALPDAGSESCTTTNDHVHVLGNRDRWDRTSGRGCHGSRRPEFGIDGCQRPL